MERLGEVGVLNLSIFLHNFHAACILSMDILTSETHFPMETDSKNGGWASRSQFNSELKYRDVIADFHSINEDLAFHTPSHLAAVLFAR